MVAIMGTSTCHVMNGDVLAEVPGMCGVVDGGIVPGLWGYEAGQSGVGDIFGWFVDERGARRRTPSEAARRGLGVHEHLTELAAAQPVGEHGLVALDWHSGNRSVLVDHELSGLVVGLTLATRPEDVYRALLEATAFGTRMIIEAFDDAGRAGRRELVVAGGLLKNPLLMQIYADVTRLPLSHDRLRAGPGARLGDPRRGRRRRVPRRPRRGRGDGPRATAAVYVPDPSGRRRPTTRCSPSTARCTTTSAAAANDGRCTGCGAIRREAHARRCRRRATRTTSRATLDRAARRGRRAARRAGPLRPGGLDRRQRLGAGARRTT